uniref:RNA polymerase, sigma-24 subunit, ECF subfamily n=1 Tax=Solibacter usitatus (strain Ellin6076) TaxID=234267 RepID=Q026M4_SOLUE
MQTLTDLYRLAYFLTGKCDAGLDATLEAVDSTGDFFSGWMTAWSRRVVISKALAGIRDELTASARRTSVKRATTELPSRDWALSSGTKAAEFTRAILAIDWFPRCALLLSIFERMSVEDAATLLDATPELVRKGQAIGLQELTVNLARGQGWTSAEQVPYVMTGEMQHV